MLPRGFDSLRISNAKFIIPQSSVGRSVSLLISRTVCTMGDRLLKHGPKVPPFHTVVCNSSLRELYYTYSPATSFAVFPLRSSSLPSTTRRAQGCKPAGCRRRQERCSPLSTLKTSLFLSRDSYMNTMILCECNRTVSPYNIIDFQPWLSASGDAKPKCLSNLVAPLVFEGTRCVVLPF